MKNMVKNSSRVLLRRLVSFIIFFGILFASDFLGTSLLCINSRPGDACADFGLVLLPFAGIFSIIATVLLMKKMFVVRVENPVNETESGDGKLTEKQKTIIYLILLVIVLFIWFKFFTLTKYGH